MGPTMGTRVVWPVLLTALLVLVLPQRARVAHLTNFSITIDATLSVQWH